ncbi:MAG: type II toxin-antitoxin system PemK/MazF family toxin [Deltaproteobacteria bacterium]|nr:type II toxin-antitoxin system PemK/MazF family toxin [Deltaproteobacteria bacterium]
MAWRMRTLNCKRYEIYYADLNPTIGNEIKKIRPVMIINKNEMNKYLDNDNTSKNYI